jgi:phosphoglycerate dehydrogenase-like enzyme
MEGMPVLNQPPRVVLVTWQTLEPFHRALTTPCTLIPAPSAKDEDVAPLLPGAEVMVTGRFTKGMAEQADALRLIHTPGAGLDGIDLAAVPPGTAVCNVYGHERGIAEYVFMTMAALNRQLFRLDRQLRQGDWSAYTAEPLPELRGRTLAIIGLGRIGAEVARWGRFLDMRVVAVTRTPNQDQAAQLGLDWIDGLSALPRALAEADFVVIAAPLNAETRGMIGREQLSAMKPSAFLVNVARGGLIDETALYDALRDRTIAGAAIDVWYRYPDGATPALPSALPFHELDNIIMTPHIAGATDATFTYRWSVINENLRRLTAGEPLLNVVKPADG